MLFPIRINLIPHHILFQLILPIHFILLVKRIIIKQFLLLLPLLIHPLTDCEIDLFQVLDGQGWVRDAVVDDYEV